MTRPLYPQTVCPECDCYEPLKTCCGCCADCCDCGGEENDVDYGDTEE